MNFWHFSQSHLIFLHRLHLECLERYDFLLNRSLLPENQQIINLKLPASQLTNRFDAPPLIR